MEIEQTVKSTQDQATAAWIQHLNQLRLDELLRKLAEQDLNLEAALKSLDKIRLFINDPSHILGSAKTKHGEIAEYMQVYFSNALKQILGENGDYTFDGVGRTAPEDYRYKGQPVQSKFYGDADQSGIQLGRRTFQAIKGHLEKYPDFLEKGGRYEIPKDQFERITELMKKKPSELSRAEYNLVQTIRQWEQDNGCRLFDKVFPSLVDYKETMHDVAGTTVDNKEKEIRNTDKARREAAHTASRPTLQEGVEVTIQAAVLESAVAFGLGVYRKLKSGKKLHDFTAEDWKDLGIDTAGAAVKGGIRGSTVYLLTNYANTPGYVATAFVTAMFGIAAQAKLLREGKISKYEFVDNISVIALDVSVSAVSSFIGGKLIPIDVLGPIIGNTVGMFLYGVAKDYLSEKEQKLVASFVEEIERLNEMLEARYKELIDELKAEFEKFSSIVELAFSDETNEAFNNSIVLAGYVGVEENALRDIGAVNDYFLA